MTWENLQKISTHTAVRSAFIWLFAIPPLAQLFSTVNQLPLIDLKMPLNFLLNYATAVSFFLGGCIYGLRCPSLSRLSRQDILQLDVEEIKSLALDTKDFIFKKNKNRALRSRIIMSKYKNELFESTDQSWIIAFSDAKIVTSSEKEHFIYACYSTTNESARLAMYSSLLCYFLGFLLIGFTIFINAINVLSILQKHEYN